MLFIRRQVCRRTERMSRTNRTPPTGYPGGNAVIRSKARYYKGFNKHKILMNNYLQSRRCLRGCNIALGGQTYRVISVLRTRQVAIGYAILIYTGKLPCFPPEPQVAQAFGLNGRRYLNLCHGWLQNGHKGVICAFAEVRRLGIAQGEIGGCAYAQTSLRSRPPRPRNEFRSHGGGDGMQRLPRARVPVPFKKSIPKNWTCSTRRCQCPAAHASTT